MIISCVSVLSSFTTLSGRLLFAKSRNVCYNALTGSGNIPWTWCGGTREGFRCLSGSNDKTGSRIMIGPVHFLPDRNTIS
jgi:hypothetical protein